MSKAFVQDEQAGTVRQALAQLEQFGPAGLRAILDAALESGVLNAWPTDHKQLIGDIAEDLRDIEHAELLRRSAQHYLQRFRLESGLQEEWHDLALNAWADGDMARAAACQRARADAYERMVYARERYSVAMRRLP